MDLNNLTVQGLKEFVAKDQKRACKFIIYLKKKKKNYLILSGRVVWRANFVFNCKLSVFLFIATMTAYTAHGCRLVAFSLTYK